MAAHPQLGDLAHLWPSFVGAVNDPVLRAQPGGIGAYVWASVRNDYLGRGEALPPGAFQAVNAGLSLAGAQRRASLALQQASDFVARTGIDQGITAEHISRAIDAAPLGSQPLGPQHRITYTAGFIIGGVLVDVTLTHDAGYDLPQSISALNDLIDQAAQAAAADYGYEYTGSSAVLSIQAY